jgi:molybdopterin synthase sulfur carrier subunit
MMIRIELPFHLRNLAQCPREISLEVAEPVTLERTLEALEERYPVLRGLIRQHGTKKRRDLVRFFACEEDLSNDPVSRELPLPVQQGQEPLIILGAIAGG